MPERIDVDVCVVGAGYAGLTAARRLSQGGKSVVVARGARPRRRPDLDPPACPTARRSTAAARGSARRTTRSSGSRARSACPPTRRGSRARTCSSTTGRTRRYTGLIPKISPLAIVTIALAQAKLDRMAKHVPLEAPWTAKRAAEWDSRSVAWWLERSGIRTAVARDLFEMAVRGLVHRRPERGVAAPPAVPGPRRTAASTRCSRSKAALRRTWSKAAPGRSRSASPTSSATRVHLNAPVRSITQRRDHVVVEAGDLTVSARHAVVTVPPALALEIAFDPALPDDRVDAVPQRGRRPGDEDARRLRRAVLARRRLQRAVLRAQSASEVTLDATPGVGKPRCHRVVHLRAGRRARRRARRRRAPAGRARRAHGPVRPARRVTGRVHRDAVVEGGVDARLLDGASPAGDPHALRAAAARAVRTRALGGNRDVDDLARRDRRRRPLRASAPPPRSSVAPEFATVQPSDDALARCGPTGAGS